MNLHDFDIIFNQSMELEPLKPEDMLRYASPEVEEEPIEIQDMKISSMGKRKDLAPLKKHFDIGVRE